MNKKQRNRKQVAQNQRNKLINRRYSSTIKTLFKFFLNEIRNFNLFLENKKSKNTIDKNFLEFEEKKLKNKISKLINLLFSIIDKASKKKVIHKNTAARKKSRINKLFLTIKN